MVLPPDDGAARRRHCPSWMPHGWVRRAAAFFSAPRARLVLARAIPCLSRGDTLYADKGCFCSCMSLGDAHARAMIAECSISIENMFGAASAILTIIWPPSEAPIGRFTTVQRTAERLQDDVPASRASTFTSPPGAWRQTHGSHPSSQCLAAYGRGRCAKR